MSRTTTAPSRVLVIISTMVVALVLLLASAVGATGDAPDAAPSVLHQVHRGDTLWEIAAEHTPEGDDVRATVDAIKRHNDLSGSLITPGQQLEIPTG